MKEHVKYIDLAKTMAIFLVVFGHTIELTKISEELVGNLDLFAYTLHVPTFLFVSGFLFQKTIQHHNVKRIVVIKFLDLFCVWLIWSGILTAWNMGVDMMFGQYTGNILGYVMYSANEVWYFVFLFVGLMIILTFEALKINRQVCTMGLLVSFLIASFFSVGIAKVILHTLIIWIGYCFQEWNRKKATLILIAYGVVMIVIYATGCLSLKSVAQPGISALGLLAIKLLSCLVLPAIAFLLQQTMEHADRNMHADSSRNLQMRFEDSEIRGFRKNYQVSSYIGSNTLYIYILHFLPLAIYKCIGIDSLIIAIACVCGFILIALLLRRIIEGRVMEKILFIPHTLFLRSNNS